eukprot:1377830-Prymnesium_polylepis.1
MAQNAAAEKIEKSEDPFKFQPSQGRRRNRRSYPNKRHTQKPSTNPEPPTRVATMRPMYHKLPSTNPTGGAQVLLSTPRTRAALSWLARSSRACLTGKR